MDPLAKKEIIELFNDKPKNGINKIKEWCESNSKNFAEETAKFLHEEKNNLNLESVGDYLGTKGTDNEKVLEHFVKQFDFKKKDYLESLREFLVSFKLPGEGQKVGRLVESFGNTFYEQNPNKDISHADTALIAAFATVGLNTNLHNSSMKDKWTFEQFKDQLKGLNTESDSQNVNSGKNFSDEFLRKIYDGIKAKPFELNFTETAPGYEIAGINSQDDKTFKKLNDFLAKKIDIKNAFSNLENDITAEYKQPKTWLNKFTGYEGSIILKSGNAEVEMQVYKPNIFSKWFLGKKNKVVIQPKGTSKESLKLAAQIAASFETKVTSIKATYDYLKEDLETYYENPKKELEKASSVAELHNNMRETTEKIQKNDTQIPDIRQKPLASKENFEDLTKSGLGKPTQSRPLSFEEDLAKKVSGRKIESSVESKESTKSTEEKIDNHTKRLEELKQKQEKLEASKKELEDKKASASTTREERWKIVANLEIISNQLKSVQKERDNINSAADREKQFNNKSAQSPTTKKDPSAAEMQQQAAMEAIKRMKEQKQQEEAASKGIDTNNNPVVPTLKPGVIPPPPPLPGSNYSIPKPPPMPELNKQNNDISTKVQKEAQTITRQISGGNEEHTKALGDAIKRRRESLERKNSSSPER